MLIIPYSTALTLGRPPYISYAVVALCAVVYTLQLGTSITEGLVYYPDSWNPLRMISASFGHLDFRVVAHHETVGARPRRALCDPNVLSDQASLESLTEILQMALLEHDGELDLRPGDAASV